jgi:alpha-L-fucosidase 2
MRTLIIIAFWAGLFAACTRTIEPTPYDCNDLHFSKLASSWDEAIPLGNGILGALIWQKGENLRFSLDRADLWDLRPMPNLNKPEWKYSWVCEQWQNKNYKEVQVAFDKPYDDLPAPSKIPAGALEFDVSKLGETQSVTLDISNAVCEVIWKNGTKLQTFVHAGEPFGWFRFENLPAAIKPGLISPAYNREGDNRAKEMSFFDLSQLGYSQGILSETKNTISWKQEGWGGFKYEIFVEWETRESSLTGCWSISSSFPGWKTTASADIIVTNTFNKGYRLSSETHKEWWKNFWNASSVSIPDTIIEKQWFLEMYKFGSAARKEAPPISLQAVWTADNGKLPPWKGDFHNDLNTQLSYWPAYSSNHIDLEEGFINWLFNNRETFKKYTKTYFGKSGLNVPGVATLTGEPMGGWIQYSFGPTVSAWLAQHFYLHWRYTMDKTFLSEKAYPWIRDVVVFLDELSIRGKDSKRKLPLSSSPEIFNNSAQAWFSETSNFDLALIRWTYEKAAELSGELGIKEDSLKWRSILGEWPDYTIDPKTGLMFAPGIPYSQSHRHFSHLMAFHPLGIIDFSKGDSDKIIIENTLTNLAAVGSDWWCGYSFSWLGNLYARALDGEKAAEALRTFAACFCLPNSFHVNGDQTKSGKSKFTYRPFTLEGNFAFAAGVQEMLIQSHAGFVQIFPAVPRSWKDVSFKNLRTEGAFLVSAERKQGDVTNMTVFSEKGGQFVFLNPFKGTILKSSKEYEKKADLIEISFKPGEIVNLQNL